MKTGLVALSVFAICGSASAAPLYSQPDNAPGSGGYFSVGGPGQFFTQRMADDFTIAGGTVTSLRWWGSSQNFQFADLTNITGFDVAIFGDLGGIPDAGNVLYHSQPVKAGLTITPTGNLSVANAIQYQFDLNIAPLNLAGGKYWLSVGGLLANPFGDTFVWNVSATGNTANASFFYPNSGWIAFSPSDNMAFEIIPAPGALALLGMGGLIAGRRRR
ncbi:MAG: hypothetical protein KF691_12270 [Phycisphaeraceae bacterium]|nr:hypothetical protein [Phycisphaeraceae bacterium]